MVKQMSEFRKAAVYVGGKFAGLLCESDNGYSFKYDTAYLLNPVASAVSLTLPLTENEYTSKVLFPFFDGLIPEGWLLSVVSRNWKINPDDRFGLLLITTKDCIGNVTVEEAKI